MNKKEPLTSEAVKGKFKSQFDLVNYAIRLADQMIRTGRGPRIHSDNTNPAVVVVEEIEEGKDLFEEPVFVSEEIIEESEVEVEALEQKKGLNATKSLEKKKTRRILA